MKQVIFLLPFIAITFMLSAQQIEKQNTFKFPTLSKDSYLGNVSYNPVDKLTSLQYATKGSLESYFSTYVFDEDLNFLKEFNEERNITDDIQEKINVFKWFTNKYKGEEYVKEGIYLYPGVGGKLVAQKVKYRYAYEWDEAQYYPKTEVLETKTFQGEDTDRLYLYETAQLPDGGLLVLAGLKASKTSKVKFQQARSFQLIKINTNLEIEYLDKITFPNNMAVTFVKVLSNESSTIISEDPSNSGFVKAEMKIHDLSLGKLLLVFTPVKSILQRDYTEENPSKHTMLIINQDGTIAAKENYTSPVSGWIIEDIILSGNENEFFFYGPAANDQYVNKLIPTNSPFNTTTESVEIKWRSFQLAKVVNDKIAWIKDTDLEEFEKKAIAPPSQKKIPIYKGERFIKSTFFASPSGEVFIGGQNYKEKILQDAPIKKEGFKDLVMFHFDNTGKLKAQYGVRREERNGDAKDIPAPQDICISADGKAIYWIYGEIEGFRGDGYLLGNPFLKISKAKLLVYPAISKINAADGSIEDPVFIGTDEKGRPKYYAHHHLSHVVSADGNYLTFIGEDHSGSNIWLGRMKL